MGEVIEFPRQKRPYTATAEELDATAQPEETDGGETGETEVISLNTRARVLSFSEFGETRRRPPTLAERTERKYGDFTIGIFESLTPVEAFVSETITGIEHTYIKEGYTVCVSYNILSKQQNASYERLVRELKAAGQEPKTKGMFVNRYGKTGEIVRSAIHVWLKPETKEPEKMVEAPPRTLDIGCYSERIDNFSPPAETPAYTGDNLYELQMTIRSRRYANMGYNTRITYDFAHPWQKHCLESSMHQLEKMNADGEHPLMLDGFWVHGKPEPDGRQLVYLWVKPQWLT